MKFYLSFHMSSIVSNAKGNTISQFTGNLCQLIYSNTRNHLILTFKSCNELGLVAYTIVFTFLHKKSNKVKSGKCGGQENGPPLSIKFEE